MKCRHSPTDKSLIHTAIVQPLQDMFRCSFKTLSREILLNPFYWNNGYYGLQNYIQCAQNNSVTEDVIYQCLSFIEEPCPLNLKFGTNNNARIHQCYKALKTSRHLAKEKRKKLMKNKVGDFDTVSLYNECISSLYKRIMPCMFLLQLSCLQSRLVAVKTIRLEMQFAHELLSREPGLKVVHLTRDPRGMMLSRSDAFNNSVTKKNAEVACTMLKRNLKSLHAISEKFPKATIQIRYEDLVENPVTISQQIYSHVGLPKEVAKDYFISWLNRISNPVRNTGTYRTYRQNSTAEAYDWLNKLSFTNRRIIESLPVCAEIIRELKYPNVL